MEALRAEGPLDTREITLRVLRAKDLNEADAVLRNGVSFHIIHALSRQAVKGGRGEAGEEEQGVCVVGDIRVAHDSI